MENKTAQQLIEESNFTDNLEFFYPEIAKQEQADLNITKILKIMKGGIKQNGRNTN